MLCLPLQLILTQDKAAYAVEWQIVTISPERHMDMQYNGLL